VKIATPSFRLSLQLQCSAAIVQWTVAARSSLCRLHTGYSRMEHAQATVGDAYCPWPGLNSRPACHLGARDTSQGESQGLIRALIGRYRGEVLLHER
jgi:hypothetical protein